MDNDLTHLEYDDFHESIKRVVVTMDMLKQIKYNIKIALHF